MKELGAGDALIVVDVQRDFCPGGKLAVEEGDRVVPVLNEWIARAQAREVPVFASRDWHPPGHCSFREQGGEWPAHCVQDSEGASFHEELDLPATTRVVTKGDHPEFDQYSAFDRTGLAEELRRRGVERVWIGGLAQDVCVRATALDAAEEGFETHLLLDATRPVDPRGGRKALEEMREAGVLMEEGAERAETADA